MASVAPVDQGSILRSGAALIPDISEQIMRQRLLGIQEQQAQTGAASQARLQANDLREQLRQQQYQAAVAAMGDHPTLEQLSQLMLQFPEASEAVRRTYDAMDDTQRQGEFRAAAELHSALVNGQPQVAARILRQRIDADRAAGQEPERVDELMLEAIESGDPAQIARATSIARRNAAIMAGPQQYASVYGVDDPDLMQVEAGASIIDRNRVGATGDPQDAVVYESPYVRGADGVLYERPQTGAQGATPSGGGDPSRVMNYEARAAGFNTVPADVTTLGQASEFARRVNRAGVRSSAMGTYQIVGDTLRRYAPRVFGQQWENVEFTPENQDRIAEAIFNDHRGSAQALRSQWVSLSQRDAERIRRMPWQQARGEIARAESGGSGGGGQQPVRVRSIQEARALPPGTQFFMPGTNDVRTRN